MVKKKVGAGLDTYFWTDPWLDGDPLNKWFPRLFSVTLDSLGTVGEVVERRNEELVWKWRWQRELFHWEREQVEELKCLMAVV